MPVNDNTHTPFGERNQRGLREQPPATTDTLMAMLTEQWTRANAAEERLARVTAAYAALKAEHAAIQQRVPQKQVMSMHEAIERVTTRKKPRQKQAVGRPTILTPKILRALHDSIVSGKSITQACHAVGVSKYTYIAWRERGLHPDTKPIFREFRQAMRNAIEERDRRARGAVLSPSP